ncbi:27389_t:CDS:2, partial [Racocetra persica]
KGNTPVHSCLLEKIDNIKMNDLTYDDPLANGVIDLGCNYFQVAKKEFDVLLREKAGIKKLNKELSIKILCADFVEPIYIREEVAHNLLNIILQETKMDIHQISKYSENTLVEIIGHLIDTAMCNLLVKFDVKVIRPDLMIKAFFQRKWNELAYVESGRWKSNEDK